MAVSYTLLMHPKFRSLLLDGTPNAGGKVYTYLAGTTTPATTYRDAGLVAANANPVVLDAQGQAEIFYAGPYKLVCQDAAGVQLWSADNLYGFNGDVVASLPVQDQDKLLVWSATDGAFKNSNLTLEAIENAVATFNQWATTNGQGSVAAAMGDASLGTLDNKIDAAGYLAKEIVADVSGNKTLSLRVDKSPADRLALYRFRTGL